MGRWEDESHQDTKERGSYRCLAPRLSWPLNGAYAYGRPGLGFWVRCYRAQPWPFVVYAGSATTTGLSFRRGLLTLPMATASGRQPVSERHDSRSVVLIICLESARSRDPVQQAAPRSWTYAGWLDVRRTLTLASGLLHRCCLQPGDDRDSDNGSGHQTRTTARTYSVLILLNSKRLCHFHLLAEGAGCGAAPPPTKSCFQPTSEGIESPKLVRWSPKSAARRDSGYRCLAWCACGGGGGCGCGRVPPPRLLRR